MRRLVRFALVEAVLGSVVAILAPAGAASPQARDGSGVTALTGVQVKDPGELRGVATLATSGSSMAASLLMSTSLG
jgi:hypothetical protein